MDLTAKFMRERAEKARKQKLKNVRSTLQKKNKLDPAIDSIIKKSEQKIKKGKPLERPEFVVAEGDTPYGDYFFQDDWDYSKPEGPQKERERSVNLPDIPKKYLRGNQETEKPPRSESAPAAISATPADEALMADSVWPRRSMTPDADMKPKASPLRANLRLKRLEANKEPSSKMLPAHPGNKAISNSRGLIVSQSKGQEAEDGRPLELAMARAKERLRKQTAEDPERAEMSAEPVKTYPRTKASADSTSKIPVPSLTSKREKAIPQTKLAVPVHSQEKEASSVSSGDEDRDGDVKRGLATSKASTSLKHLRREHEEALALLKELGGEIREEEHPDVASVKPVEIIDDQADFRSQMEALRVRAKATPRSPGPKPIPKPLSETLNVTPRKELKQEKEDPIIAQSAIPATDEERGTGDPLSRCGSEMGSNELRSPSDHKREEEVEDPTYEDDYEVEEGIASPQKSRILGSEEEQKLADEEQGLDLSYSLDVRPPQSPFALSGAASPAVHIPVNSMRAI